MSFGAHQAPHLWAEQHFSGAEMSDVRRTDRIVAMLEAMADPGIAYAPLIAGNKSAADVTHLKPAVHSESSLHRRLHTKPAVELPKQMRDWHSVPKVQLMPMSSNATCLHDAFRTRRTESPSPVGAESLRMLELQKKTFEGIQV